MVKVCCEKLEDHLYRNYKELYFLILQCYKDISIINGYKELQTNKSECYNLANNFSNHILWMTQKDLALTIWKIYFDTNPKANTVPKLRNVINDKLRKLGNTDKIVKSEKIGSELKGKLNSLRNQFLAHTDATRSDSRIEISDLKENLDKICKEFNSICNIIDDERVCGITEINIGLLDLDYYVKLISLYCKE